MPEPSRDKLIELFELLQVGQSEYQLHAAIENRVTARQQALHIVTELAVADSLRQVCEFLSAQVLLCFIRSQIRDRAVLLDVAPARPYLFREQQA